MDDVDERVFLRRIEAGRFEQPGLDGVAQGSDEGKTLEGRQLELGECGGIQTGERAQTGSVESHSIDFGRIGRGLPEKHGLVALGAYVDRGIESPRGDRGALSRRKID